MILVMFYSLKDFFNQNKTEGEPIRGKEMEYNVFLFIYTCLKPFLIFHLQPMKQFLELSGRTFETIFENHFNPYRALENI